MVSCCIAPRRHNGLGARQFRRRSSLDRDETRSESEITTAPDGLVKSRRRTGSRLRWCATYGDPQSPATTDATRGNSGP